MTYFRDLSRFTYFQDRGPAVVNVGWLDAPHAYSQGDVSPADFAALAHFALHTWQPAHSMGWHDCSLCGRKQDEGPMWRVIAGQRKLLGADIIFVPDGDGMFAAPTLILHYIEHHRYAPPEAFLAAVRAADPSLPTYREACQRIWGDPKRYSSAPV